VRKEKPLGGGVGERERHIRYYSFTEGGYILKKDNVCVIIEA